MRGAAERADWDEAGRLLREEWSHRKKNAPGITTPLIDKLVEVTRKAGALGAKVCGAGGGGCVIALADLDPTPILEAWRAEGLHCFAASVGDVEHAA